MRVASNGLAVFSLYNLCLVDLGMKDTLFGLAGELQLT